MGCDIHAMMERQNKRWLEWHAAGEIDTDRNYLIFSVLADVRNAYNVEPLKIHDKIPYYLEELPEISEDFTEEFKGHFEEPTAEHRAVREATVAWILRYGTDGHSHRVAYLSQLKKLDTSKMEEDVRKSWEANCAKLWQRMIDEMENVAKFYELNDDQVRLVFFFDN